MRNLRVGVPPTRDRWRPGRSTSGAIEARAVTVPDQWQVQILARVLSRARVGVHTSGLTDAQLRTAHLFAVPDIAAAVQAELTRCGADATVCVLPEGPRTIPYVVTPPRLCDARSPTWFRVSFAGAAQPQAVPLTVNAVGAASLADHVPWNPNVALAPGAMVPL
jgi:hypothetical protein